MTSSAPASEPDIIVIGAGVAGIAAAIRFAEQGYRKVRIYEKASELGGTWRENTYPGIACDVPSHLYNFSFAINPEWENMFSPGADILAYLKQVARDFGVEEIINYNHEVASCKLVDGRWHVELTNGKSDIADIVIPATGVLHHPAYPDIPGLDDFEGTSFHTARWDHSVDLAGKRVAIIGTGSTAAQVVSSIVSEVGELKVFQRTPQWVIPVPNEPIPEEKKAKFRADPEALKAHYQKLSDKGIELFSDAVVDADAEQLGVLTQLCEAHLATVNPPELREKLRPDYRVGCKRLVVSSDFYSAIQQPNAHLVTEGIDRIEPNGIRTDDGVVHEIDILVLATGFRVDAFTRPMKVVGRGGADLDEVWAKRPGAYLSVSIPDFPNFFLLNGPNGPVGNINLIQVAEFEIGYILKLIEPLRQGQVDQISASSDALKRFDTARLERAGRTVWATGCNSWYLDDRGIPLVWPWSFKRFEEAMQQPDFADYELFKDGKPVSLAA